MRLRGEARQIIGWGGGLEYTSPAFFERGREKPGGRPAEYGSKKREGACQTRNRYHPVAVRERGRHVSSVICAETSLKSTRSRKKSGWSWRPRNPLSRTIKKKDGGG